jgi:hypothetical protein
VDQSSSEKNLQAQAKRRRQLIGFVSYYKRYLLAVETRKLIEEEVKIIDLKYLKDPSLVELP